MVSRYAMGGFEERYIVVRRDGQPTRPEARYIVLDYSGADPHAVAVLRDYAERVRPENPQFATELLAALVRPGEGPAQHPCADSKK